MGKRRIVAETGAGQHGVATATVVRAARPRVPRLHGRRGHGAAGAERRSACGCSAPRCCRVDAGSRTLKDAINEAMRDWVTNVGDTYYLLGSVLGPHPYPLMVREFQSVIGREARAQILELDRPPARRGRRLRRRRQQRHGHLRRVHRRRRRAADRRRGRRRADRARAATRRGLPAAAPACCRARARSSCRTTTATSS